MDFDGEMWIGIPLLEKLYVTLLSECANLKTDLKI